MSSNSVSSKKKAKKKRRAVVSASSADVAHSAVDQGGKAENGVDKGERTVNEGKKSPAAASSKGGKSNSKRMTEKAKKVDVFGAGSETPSPTTTTTSTSGTTTTTTTSITSFEEELEWCIGRLELGMLRPGANKSQKKQNERSIHTLRAAKTPLPKKRLLMRSLLGDYRSKMKTQPIPEGLVTKPTKLAAVKPEVIETVGTYYRSHEQTVHEVSSDEFRFNFNISVD